MKPELYIRLTLCAVFCFPAISLRAQEQAADKQMIDGTIARFYKVVSYSNARLDSVAVILDLLTSDATLLGNIGEQPQKWSAKEFIRFMQDGASKQSITDRLEKELFETTSIFGKVAQRFSSYQIAFSANGKAVTRRGVNAIQLLRLGGQWKIYSIVWDIERPGLAVPLSGGKE